MNLLIDIATLSPTPMVSTASSSTLSSVTIAKTDSQVEETSMSISVDVKKVPTA
jgi:hypothetical protein